MVASIRWVWAILSVGAVACGGSEVGTASYVLVDRDARAAGYAIETEGQISPAVMPIAIDGSQATALVGAAVHDSVTAEPGELVYVHGSRGTLDRLLIGRDVEPDSLLVDASQEAAEELAARLGGEVTPVGGKWRVSATDALVQVAGEQSPPGLLGVAPVEITSAPQNSWQGAPSTLEVSPAGAASLPEVDARLREATVQPTGFLGVTGCAGAEGIWRARVYSEEHLEWYDFTLRIRSSPERSGELRGVIEVDVWDGSPERSEPPSNCRGGVGRSKVHEPATGRLLPGGTVEFDGLSWRLRQRICGDSVANYCVDHFKGPITGGGTLFVAGVTDHCLWTDRPVVLTRVKCRA